MKLYVGNLSFNTSEDELREAFEAFGAVRSSSIVMDRFTGRSRGFGFVEMDDESQAKAAIEGMHGKNFGGRELTVNEAQPPERRSGGFGGGGGGGGRGGYGGGGGGGGGRGGDRGDRGSRGGDRGRRDAW